VTMLATNFVWQIVNWPGFWPLLTVVASLLAAWIGGRIAGKYALEARRQAALDQRKRDREMEKQASMGILRAIEAELKVHKNALEPLLVRLKKTPPSLPLATMPVDQNFSLFLMQMPLPWAESRTRICW
jgi:hypothetical protein